jgi:hypothetical protein
MLFPGLYRVPVTVTGVIGEEWWDDIDWYDQDIIVWAKNREEAKKKAKEAYAEAGLEVFV